MNYLNPNYEPVSTVQLSPFVEEQWNRMVTYSPVYVHWTDVVMMTRKQLSKPTTFMRRNLSTNIDLNNLKLEDELLLTQIHQMRRSVGGAPSIATSNEKSPDQDLKSIDEQSERRPTSPTEEYQKSNEFFYPTRETMRTNCTSIELINSNRSGDFKNTPVQPKISNSMPMKTLSNINLGPKPRKSLGIQLRQSAITRENALSTSTDFRSISPVSIASSRRAAGNSFHLGRLVTQQNRTVSSSKTPASILSTSTPRTTEKITADPSNLVRKVSGRATTASRSTVSMVKTKTERARQKQLVDLKTILVKPCQQPIKRDAFLEDSIPSFVEKMYQIGGSESAFEKNLKYNYKRQLDDYRNGSGKC